MVPKVVLGSRVGIQATFAKADISGELILASSVTPPDLDKGPTGSTLHNINSLQNSCNIDGRVRIVTHHLPFAPLIRFSFFLVANTTLPEPDTTVRAGSNDEIRSIAGRVDGS